MVTVRVKPRDGSKAGGNGRSRSIELGSVRGDTLVIEPAGDEPSWFKPTVEQMAKLLQLPADWDSYGAHTIDPQAAAAALQLLAETMHSDTPPPIVTPTNRGGIQLEWHTRGMDLEVKPKAPDRVYVYCDDVTEGRESEYELGSDLSALMNILTDLAHRG